MWRTYMTQSKGHDVTGYVVHGRVFEKVLYWTEGKALRLAITSLSYLPNLPVFPVVYRKVMFTYLNSTKFFQSAKTVVEKDG